MTLLDRRHIAVLGGVSEIGVNVPTSDMLKILVVRNRGRKNGGEENGGVLLSYLVRPPSVCQRLWIPLALLTFFKGHYFMPQMSLFPLTPFPPSFVPLLASPFGPYPYQIDSLSLTEGLVCHWKTYPTIYRPLPSTAADAPPSTLNAPALRRLAIPPPRSQHSVVWCPPERPKAGGRGHIGPQGRLLVFGGVRDT